MDAREPPRRARGVVNETRRGDGFFFRTSFSAHVSSSRSRQLDFQAGVYNENSITHAQTVGKRSRGLVIMTSQSVKKGSKSNPIRMIECVTPSADPRSRAGATHTTGGHVDGRQLVTAAR